MAESESKSNLNLKASKKEWMGLFVLALTCMLYSMDLTVLNLALPQISRDLKPSSSQLLWIVDIYGFFLAGSLITMGTLGDRIGRRKMLLIGGALFALVSAVAAFSKSSEMLIFLRALQGIAGATLAPSTLSLIRVLFRNPQQRAIAMGLWGTSFSVGGLIGPLIGGLLLENFWWGSVLLINVPVMLLMILLGPILLPEYKDPQAGKIDLFSAGLSLVSVLLIVLGLKKSVELGLQILPVLSFFSGIFLAYVFIQRQSRLKNPLIEISLFHSLKFNVLLATNFFTMFVVFGTFIFTSQYMQLIMGLSPLAAGAWSMAFSAGFIISSLLSPLLARKIRAAYVMTLGLLLAACGFALVSQVNGVSDLFMLATGTFIFSFGCSPVLLFTTGLLVNSAPAEKAGVTAAISETSNELGGALGIAVLGSLGTYIYHKKLIALSFGKVDAPTLNAFQGTLSSALTTVEKLPSELSAKLIPLIHTSFINSFEAIMLISGFSLVLLSGLVCTQLRDVKLEDEH